MLELYDPLTTAETLVGDQRVPLESDLTTPLAYFLSEAASWTRWPRWACCSPTTLLKQLRPGRPKPIMGLYMVQPYEPGKIPVLMVHGLWSSPMTWMEMFNDLRSQPEIRDHYQFWFYLYPDGPAVLAQRRATAPRPGRGPRGARSATTRSRRWTRWC